MKKEEFKYCIGIDVSKLTLDLAILDRSGKIESCSHTVSNNKKGMTDIARWIRGFGLKFNEILFCMEFTGVYNAPLQKFLHSKDAFIWMEMPVRIIRSIGLQRGKNDKVDAQRIAAYASRYESDKVQWTPPCPEQEAIQDLINLRVRLISAKNTLLVPIQELSSMNEKARSQHLDLLSRQSVKGLEANVKKVEERIQALVSSLPVMERNIQLLKSIRGIGFWTALQMACATDNFQRRMTANQLACYCGCAPFEHRSGSSIRGKARVSHMANKNLKTLLTLCAISVIRTKGEMADYYNRKVAEGKNKMSVINAIRSKLIHRIVAVIERQTPYVDRPHLHYC